MRFDQGRTAFDPVSVIAMQYAVDFRNLRMMNVAADDPVNRHAGQRVFKVPDVIHGILYPVFQVGCQRPVREIEKFSEEMYVYIGT